MDPQPQESAREGTYTLRRGDQSYGPYTTTELAAYMAAGNVVAGDALFDHEAQTWTTAGELAMRRASATGAMSAPAPSSVTPGAAPPAPAPAAAAVPARGTNALPIIAVVCGALSLVGCGFLTGIAAIILGARHYPEPSDASVARIGLVLGIIGTVLSVLLTCAWLVFFPFSL